MPPLSFGYVNFKCQHNLVDQSWLDDERSKAPFLIGSQQSYQPLGPWNLVDNRIWGLDMNMGEAWQIRPREEEGESVGYEYWHADGIHISYPGRKVNGYKFFGQCRYDGTEIQEYDFPHETGHIYSNAFDLIVVDGGKEVRLWKWNGNGFDGPRALCQHRSSMHIQQTHVHPRFSPDGSYVVFTSDVSGYGNVYKVIVPEFEVLPPITD